MHVRSLKILSIVFALVTVLTNFGAVAGTGSTGGGDIQGLEFIKAINSALHRIETKLPLIREKVDLKGLYQLVQEVNVIVVETPLKVKRDGVEQESTAMNDRVAKVIYLNREKWTETLNPLLQEAIALHEYLSLAGLEDTGQYFISSAYLRALGEIDDPLILPNRTPAQKNNPEGARLMDEYQRVKKTLCEFKNWAPEDPRCKNIGNVDLRAISTAYMGKEKILLPPHFYGTYLADAYHKRGYATFSTNQVMKKFEEEPCVMGHGPQRGQPAATAFCFAVAINKLLH